MKTTPVFSTSQILKHSELSDALSIKKKHTQAVEKKKASSSSQSDAQRRKGGHTLWVDRTAQISAGPFCKICHLCLRTFLEIEDILTGSHNKGLFEGYLSLG